MIRTLQRWLAALLLGGVLSVPALAQPPEKEEDKGRGPPVPQSVVAFLVTVLVLSVVCIPSRRQ
ncbi:MAG TPA: hypothetical protein VNX28_03550 [Gemmataceae bacterium]|nr:hypothetical protein [Gemmataceae bacterium]